MHANQNVKSDNAQCRCTSLLSVAFAIAAKQISCFEIDSNFMVRNKKGILELVILNLCSLTKLIPTKNSCPRKLPRCSSLTYFAIVAKRID